MTPIERTKMAWESMRYRCAGRDARTKKYYAARGISVCAAWDDEVNGFDNFLRDMGPCPPQRELDRRNNNHGYSAWNCRWTTRKVQNRNTRKNRYVVYLGRRMACSEAAEAAGWIVSGQLAAVRVARGWDAREAVETPPWG